MSAGEMGEDEEGEGAKNEFPLTFTLLYCVCHIPANNSGFLICLFVCLCTHNFVPKLVCLCITILPAAFYNHCLPFECTYHALTICHM